MEISDEAAVELTRRGDPDAFRILVDRHSRAVYRLAWRMTANSHEAEDIVQETFLRAYKQLKRFDGRAAFGTWVQSHRRKLLSGPDPGAQMPAGNHRAPRWDPG